MPGWLGAAYPAVKAAHVIVVMFWIAGLFMLPRYLAYQAEVAVGSPEDLNWRCRTRRIRRIILQPALVASWLLGLLLATSYGFAGAHWLHAKILLVALLSLYHLGMLAIAARMETGARPLSGRRLRLLNEVPGIATILIVALVVIKPF